MTAVSDKKKYQLSSRVYYDYRYAGLDEYACYFYQTPGMCYEYYWGIVLCVCSLTCIARENNAG